MRVPRFVLFAICTLVGALPAAADDPAVTALEGTRAVVSPPDGDYEHSTETPAPGQWQVAWRRGDGLVLEARVFPVQAATDPKAVLVQAVARLARTQGFEGFGIPSHGPVDVWGVDAADGRFEVAIDGKPRSGRCRLLRASAHQWAFAWGLPGPDATPADRKVVLAFVESLEPHEPAFFFRPFRDEKELAMVVTPEGAPEVTGADVRALAGVLEIGVGMRLSLREAASRLLAILTLHARRPGVRDLYVRARRVVDESASLPTGERHEQMAKAGRELLAALRTRAENGDELATSAVRTFLLATPPAFEGGPSRSAVASREELALFLATVANDGPPGAGPRAEAISAKDFAALPPSEQDAWRRAGATWAHLRQAWDQAAAPARFAFRRAVARELAGDEPPPVDAGPKALYRFMHGADDAEARVATLIERARALSGDDVAALIAVLGVEDAGFRLGW